MKESKSMEDALKESDVNLVVYLHPSKAKCANEAILRELSSMLFTYNETFEGVVLAYDPNICSNLARILPGINPYFGVRLKAKLLLFNPKPDMVLEGEVVKVTPHSINAVVLGFSSTYIADEDIRAEFKYKSRKGEGFYVSRVNKKHKIKVGTILRFWVKSFDEEKLHISGSLRAEHTGSAQWLHRNSKESSQADGIMGKRKHEEEDKVPGNDGLEVHGGASSLRNDDQIKKSKKRKHK